MLLDMDRDDVPNWADTRFFDEGEFFTACDAWLAERGLTTFTVPFNASLGEVQEFMRVVNPGLYYILGGESRSGVNHSVVGLNDKIVADPSLTDAGIVGPCAPQGFYWITMLVPLHQRANGVKAHDETYVGLSVTGNG